MLILALFITIIHFAYAATEVKLVDRVGEDHSVTETIRMAITNNTKDFLDFKLPDNSYNVKIGNTSVKIENNSARIALSCANCQVEVSYRIDNAVIASADDTHVFSRTLNIPRPVYLRYEVQLPPGYILPMKANEPPVVPTPTQITTDGTHIIVVWTEVRPELPKRYFISYQFLEQLSIGLEITEWPVWILIGCSIIVGMAVSYLFIKVHAKKKKKYEHLPQVPASLFSPDEKAILKLLAETNPLHQREMVKKLGWSKSKVSAVVTNLLYKQIIRKEKIGRNFKVELLKKVELE